MSARPAAVPTADPTADRTTARGGAALAPASTWTRDRWVATADALLAATLPYASPGRALIALPGPVSASGSWSDGLEGFARTFLLAALRVRGEGGADPHGLLERYADGLRQGTDPASRERWPRILERRQAVVEAASVAVGLAETRPWLWDRLDDGTRQRVVDWLADIVGTRGYRNNWLWFQNVVEAFLASVGGPWDPTDVERNDDLAEALYVGDGWYSDGRGRDGRRQSFDYYAGWAWHLYPVLHARITGRPLAGRHAERLRAYLEQAQHLVGPTGAPVLQGRSVTYRWAMLAPFWAGALAGATPLAPGATRALTSAVAEHFVAAGSVDERGLLPVGWHGRFDRVRQLYTGGASPYWASKGFLGLLLPPDHPVWTTPAEMPEAWRAAQVAALPAPGWLVVSTPRDGMVRVLNHGSDRLLERAVEPHADDPFYRRLAYSNRTSPQLSAADLLAPLDSHVALLDTRDVPSHRDGITRLHLGETSAASRSVVHWLDAPAAPGDAATWAAMRRGPAVTTASVVRGPLEVRVAWWSPAEAPEPGRGPRRDAGDRAGDSPDLDHDAAWPTDPGPWRFHVGGWPLAADDGGAPGGGLRVERGDDWVRVTRDDGTTSLVRALRGLDVAGATEREGADPFAARSVVPWLRGGGAAGEPVAALVVLSADAEVVGNDAASPRAAGDAVAGVHVTDHDDGARTVVVRWADGRVDRVPVPASTATASRAHA